MHYLLTTIIFYLFVITMFYLDVRYHTYYRIGYKNHLDTRLGLC